MAFSMENTNTLIFLKITVSYRTGGISKGIAFIYLTCSFSKKQRIQ